MFRLFLANTIWAFSFSLIGNYVIGFVDIYLSIFIRFVLGILLWFPQLKLNSISTKIKIQLLVIGACQIGLMYLAFYHSFFYLKVHEVALFIVATPIFVLIISDLMQRQFHLLNLLTVMLSVLGATVIRWDNLTSDFLIGFLLIQIANILYALGQVLYKNWIPHKNQSQFFALFYLGALIPILAILCFRLDQIHFSFSTKTWLTLVWLGLSASGLGYYLWNSGSKLVTHTQLAIMNNSLIPMAIVVNLVFWNGQIQWHKFILGTCFILAAVTITLKNNPKIA